MYMEKNYAMSIYLISQYLAPEILYKEGGTENLSINGVLDILPLKWWLDYHLFTVIVVISLR
jgi:hypothetical protein